MESFATKSEQSNGLIASVASSVQSSASAPAPKASSTQPAAAPAATQNPVLVSLTVCCHYFVTCYMRWVSENYNICVHAHIFPCVHLAPVSGLYLLNHLIFFSIKLGTLVLHDETGCHGKNLTSWVFFLASFCTCMCVCVCVCVFVF